MTVREFIEKIPLGNEIEIMIYPSCELSLHEYHEYWMYIIAKYCVRTKKWKDIDKLKKKMEQKRAIC